MSLDLAHLRIGPYRIHDVTTILLLATISTYLLVHFLQKFQLFSRPSTTDLERKSVATAKGKSERKPGGMLHLYPIRNLYLRQLRFIPWLTMTVTLEWIPSDFKRPPASPYPDWDVHTSKPIPYRPFRYGP